MERSNPERNLVDQEMWKVNAMFWVGNGWGNNNALPSAPLTPGIYGGAASKTTQQATEFSVRGN